MKLNSSKIVHKDIREDADFLRELLNHSVYSKILLDNEGKIVYALNSLEEIPFFNTAEPIGMDWVDLVHPEDKYYVQKIFNFLKENPSNKINSEYRIRLGEDKPWRWIEVVSKNLLQEKKIEGILLSYKDISERKEDKQRIYNYAYHDHITGLTNNTLFHDRLKYAISNAHRNNHLVGVLFLQLEFRNKDKFIVNFNDDLLKVVSRKIIFLLRETDTISRYSRNVFGIIVSDLKKYEDLSLVSQKLLEALQAPIDLKGREYFAKVSIGISVYPQDSLNAEQLISYADMTMYIAHRQSKDIYRFYNSEVDVLYKGVAMTHSS